MNVQPQLLRMADQVFLVGEERTDSTEFRATDVRLLNRTRRGQKGARDENEDGRGTRDHRRLVGWSQTRARRRTIPLCLWQVLKTS